MTGNMLFEILDPFLMWKQIFFSLKSTIDDDVKQTTGVSVFATSYSLAAEPGLA